MKNQIILILLGVLCLIPSKVSSQTNEENLKKYWESRDRYRKYFLKIGPNQGESIGANIRDRNFNNIRWSDATTHLGWYIAVLATEYELLIRDNQPTQQTLNELFFAINAVKRLDKNAEVFHADRLHDDFVTGSENGWYMRDDVPFNMAQNWSTIGFVSSNSDFYNEDPGPNSSFDYFSPGNAPSLDQTVTLLMGFRFVQKYVSNVYVNNPNGSGPGMNLFEECKNIARNIRNRLLLVKDFNQNPFDPNTSRNFRPQNYTFTDPTYNYELTQEYDRWMFFGGYPLMELIKEITGESYNGTFHFKFNDILFGTGEHNATFTPQELKSIYEKIINGVQFTVVDGSWGNVLIDWVPRTTSDWVLGNVNAFMNLRLALTMESAVKITNNTKFLQTSDELNFIIFPMIRSVLLDEKFGAPEDYTWYLNNFPKDGGYIYSENEDPNNLPSSGNAGFWSHDNRWIINNSSGSHDWSKVWITGNTSGIDYMILYNLYHLEFDHQENIPLYTPDIICPEQSQKFHIVSNSTNNPTWQSLGVTEVILNDGSTPYVLTSNREIYAYDYDAKQYNINFERYLTKDLLIQTSTGKLTLKEDVKVCNNSKVSLLLNGAKIQVGESSSTSEANLRFTEGTELDLQPNTVLEVQEGSRIIIEEGSTFKFHPNASIHLVGPNSVLEIRGKLEIMPGATFQTTGDGYVLFNIQNADPSIAPFNVQAGANSKMLFETTASGHPKKLEVNQETMLMPQATLEEFKADNVGIKIGPDAFIFLSNPFHIKDNFISGGQSDGFVFSTLSFTPEITGNTFFGCERTLTFIGRERAGRDVKIRYNIFDNCKTAIILNETSAHIAGNNFINSGGIKAGTTNDFLPPNRAGGYVGALRVELNKFQNSNALEVFGAFYPHVDYCGNVARFIGTGYQSGWTYGAEKSHNTLKCNYFEKQTEAVNISMAGSMNMSVNQLSFRAIGTGLFPNGGNNVFKDNSSSLKLIAPNPFDGLSFPYVLMQDGQNSFINAQVNTRSSFKVDRSYNLLGNNKMFDLNTNGDWEINGNLWTPTIDPLIQYGSGNYPTNTIEKNASPSHHFDIKEGSSFTPNFIVGTNTAPPSGCPILVWDDALSDPINFNPTAVSGTGFNSTSPESEKVFVDRPFGLSGQGFQTPTSTVSAGTFSGQTYGTAFDNGLSGMTEASTDEHSNPVYIPKLSGLLNMSDLLVNTASYNAVDEQDIFGFGYKLYLQCLSRAASLDVFEGSTANKDVQISAALAVFSAIETNNAQYEISDPDRYYETKFSVGVDKCHLYRLFDRYTDAQAVLGSLNSFVQTKDIKTVDYLTCQVENERRLFINEISWIDYYKNVSVCGTLYGRSEFFPPTTDTTGGDTTQGGDSTQMPSLEYIMTPNPATAQIDVTIDMNVDAVVTVTVFNKFGIQSVPTQNLGTLLTGSQTVANVILSGLPADTYNMVVYADGVPYVQHFIKLTE